MSATTGRAEKSTVNLARNWGQNPWTIAYRPERRSMPKAVDVAIVGAGFTGLAAAARLTTLEPTKKIAVFEAERIGAGSSGHTGGMALAETAAGDMPGLGDVLDGVSKITREMRLDCDLELPGVWEIDHSTANPASAIQWQDGSGKLGIAKEVPGGSVDPGKMVSELARVACERGAAIFENCRVEEVQFDEQVGLVVGGEKVRAGHVIFATNALSLELSALSGRAEAKFTLALATESMSAERIEALGLAAGKPFYTTDLPYLWGRLWQGNRLIFGSGLVHTPDWRELLSIDVTAGEAARLLQNLERRVHAFHPSLENVEITHRWGGPILIANRWQPVFAYHPRSNRGIVLGAYSGHGVMLSVYLGAWAAEAVLGRREIPSWNATD
jgi:glycine/D-amino acid oxidase-like deaminating enzyme